MLTQALSNGTRLVLGIINPFTCGQDPKQNFRELPQMVGGKYAVHMGEALPEPLLHLRLACHAAAQENLLSRVAALGVGEGSQVAEYPLLGMLPDGAGVHHHQVGPLRALAEAIAAGGQKPPNSLGVRLILLAAISLYISRGRPALTVPICLNLGAQGKLRLHLVLGYHCGFPIQWGYLRCIKNHVF